MSIGSALPSALKPVGVRSALGSDRRVHRVSAGLPVCLSVCAVGEQELRQPPGTELRRRGVAGRIELPAVLSVTRAALGAGLSAPELPADRERSPLRRLLSQVDRWASRPVTALIVIIADMTWVLLSFATGFPGLGERIFQTLVAALTLAMVFVIQHTQAREQAATQRKLDEILQALPGADNALLMLEHASHDELRATGDSHREIREAALEKQSGVPNPGG
jgi:low affinity Fe/Cu permease